MPEIRMVSSECGIDLTNKKCGLKEKWNRGQDFFVKMEWMG